jgi:hypothetical protein
VAYGTYTYIEHDIGKKAFRAHFKAMDATEAREPRWVAINDCATLKQAEEFAQKWVEEKNRLTYNRFIVTEVAVRLDKSDNRMKYHFKVTQAGYKPPVAKPVLSADKKEARPSGERSISIKSSSLSVAKEYANEWVERMNKVVYGTYKLADVREDANDNTNFHIKLHFSLTKRG